MGLQAAKEKGHHDTNRAIRPKVLWKPRIRHGRILNAVAAEFRTMLRVPIIYIEPRLKNNAGPIDILAVDAAGSGDVHIVEVKFPNNFVTTIPNLRAYINRLRDIPSHYKWLVLPRSTSAEKLLAQPFLFSADGVGRIGIILVSEGNNLEDLPSTQILVKAERFRVPSADLTSVERFIEKHQPDISVRI